MSSDFFDEEEIGFRPIPPRPYVASDVVLEISNVVLTATFRAHAGFAARRVESCCFWYGSISDHGWGRVKAVVIPVQRNSWGNYHVRSDAMASVAVATKGFGFRNLAQIHTHPGGLVEHSLYDDQMANSRRALSLVLPNYGIPGCAWPAEVGVHEFQDGYWYKLTDDQASDRVQIISNYGQIQTFDLRSK